MHYFTCCQAHVIAEDGNDNVGKPITLGSLSKTAEGSDGNISKNNKTNYRRQSAHEYVK